MPLGADSTTARNRASARLRAVISTTEASTKKPSSVSIGFSPISTGISTPSLRSPYSSRPAPIARVCGLAKKSVRKIGCPAEPLRDQVLDGLAQQLLARVAEQPLGL